MDVQKTGEQLSVSTDVPTLEQWSVRDQPFLAGMTRRTMLARTVAERMKAADVAVIVTSLSVSHTDARQEACRAGTRVASMPRFIPEMFYPGRPIDADYAAIKHLTGRIATVLTPARPGPIW